MSVRSTLDSVSGRLRRLGAVALVSSSIALGGCVASVGVAIPLGPPVVIAHGHVHSAACGHFRHRGHWYHAQGHRHGPHCGHRLQGGIWILVR